MPAYGKFISNYIKSVVFSARFSHIDKKIYTPGNDREHLVATMEWLRTAQSVTESGGVSSHFDIRTQQWGKPYCETTGYIIETFLSYYHLSGDSTYLEKAIDMGNWEVSVQCSDGAFGEFKHNGLVGKKIFNTGQVLIGLLTLYEETHDDIYLESAKKAADWLVSYQEPNGSWSAYTTQGPKTYHTRVAWPLIKLYTVSHIERYKQCALKNIEWVIEQQNETHWFDNTSLSRTNTPWTHLIAYTLSGLLEAYLLLGSKDTELFKSFYHPSKKLLEVYLENKVSFLPCSFDNKWQSKDRYSCLTGDAQLAIIWMQIYDITREKEFFDGACIMIEQIKSTQNIHTSNMAIRGGVFGSFPLSGAYAPFMLINWGAKFFADALIMKTRHI